MLTRNLRDINPILSFDGIDSLIELFNIFIVDINSLTDVGIYAGLFAQIISIILSEYLNKYFLLDQCKSCIYLFETYVALLQIKATSSFADNITVIPRLKIQMV